jgi:exodeoxyribonuclease VII large subunit
MRIISVRDLTRYLKDLLEEDYVLQDVWVRGEITNYTQSAAGHRYFTLKDEAASLDCVLFRNGWNTAALPAMRNGMAVLAHGRMSVFEQRGKVQFYVDAVEEAGIGELHLRFEELKRRLEDEGLFDEARKRSLPPCPAVVGVVTSASAAALRDIVRTLRLRCPLVRVVLAPTLVQGVGAAEQVANALDLLNEYGEAEVIIVARGGGSLEELWAFNEEVVARAIARSRVPVITGVGHETDFTIADFVADQRASTPTAAAMAAVPDASVWRDALDETQFQLTRLLDARIDALRDRVTMLRHQLERASPERRIMDTRQRVDEATHALQRAMTNLIALRGERLRASALRLHALSPLLTIARGFAVVRRQSDGEVITRVGQVAPGQALAIRVTDGTFTAVTGARSKPAPPDASETPRGAAPEQTATQRRTRTPLARTLAPADTLLADRARRDEAGDD